MFKCAGNCEVLPIYQVKVVDMKSKLCSTSQRSGLVLHTLSTLEALKLDELCFIDKSKALHQD